MGIVILGSGGMLGHMVAEHIDLDFDTMDRKDLDMLSNNPIHKDSRIINCIGLIKPHITDVREAIRVNSLFPYRLPEGTIQIATDCVYSGKKGNYVESDLHDATDVYGKTKSLGEAPHLINLRCSIIGPELKNHLSLLDWFLSQTETNGFTNHVWNGITTYHFARICRGIIKYNLKVPNLQHIVPKDKVTKYQLLQLIAESYNVDIKVNKAKAPESIDRTLSTSDPEMNLKIWRAAGYQTPPTVKQMIQELSLL